MNTSSNRRTACWHGVCSCEAGFKPAPNEKVCVEVVIGDWYNDNRKCDVSSNTRRYDNNLCLCSPPYFHSKKNNNACLKATLKMGFSLSPVFFVIYLRWLK